MTRTIFVTGGSGFVGSRLLPALVRRGHTVIALDRAGRLRPPDQAPVPSAADHSAGTLQVVTGDVLHPDGYRDALAHCDVVLHLAAATGKATAADHMRVNAEGTEALVEAARQTGVRQFAFVSSIAASFPDIARYPYARAKLRAEQAVRGSGLRYAILRPTMILGGESPILAAFEKLAMLPVIPVFGRGVTRVQPVAAADVAASLVTVVEQDLFANDTYDIGGSEIVTIEELLLRVRRARSGSAARVVHVPMGLVLAPLTIADMLGVGGALPITVGQLATFRFDGIVRPNPLHDGRKRELIALDEMLARGAEPPVARPRMTVGDTTRECTIFATHLVGRPANDYVLRKYAEAHVVSDAFEPAGAFEAWLIRTAGRHRWATMVADAYARLFLPDSALRRKLVLLLAILETCPPSHQQIDRAVGGPPALVLVRLAVRGSIAAGAALAGLVIFTPVRLAFALTGRQTR